MKLYLRYIQQMNLAGFGKEGQDKLLDARVLVIGMGGLGCPVSQYLAAAGIGTLGIVDGDKVTEGNLARQVLFYPNNTGKNKALTAKARLLSQNPQITITAYPYFISASNAADMIEQYDLVVDCTDNFPARYLINDYCVWLKKPYVHASVSGWEGQAALFNHGSDPSGIVNYRDLFVRPPEQAVCNCAETGVAGITTGLIGMLQAAQCLHFFLGNANSSAGLLYHYNTLSMQNRSWRVLPHPDNPLRKVKDVGDFIKQNKLYYDHKTN